MGATTFFSKWKRGAASFFHDPNLGGQYFFTDNFWGGSNFFGGRKGTGLYFFSPISDFPISEITSLKIYVISQLYWGTFGLTPKGGWVPYQDFGHFPKLQQIWHSVETKSTAP